MPNQEIGSSVSSKQELNTLSPIKLVIQKTNLRPNDQFHLSDETYGDIQAEKPKPKTTKAIKLEFENLHSSIPITNLRFDSIRHSSVQNQKFIT